jgi:hypothetical protein
LLAKRICVEDEEADAVFCVPPASPEAEIASEAATNGNSHARRFGTARI